MEREAPKSVQFPLSIWRVEKFVIGIEGTLFFLFTSLAASF